MVRQSQGFQLVQSALDAASQLLVCHIVRITQGWVNDILVEDVKDFSQNPVKFGSEPVAFIQSPSTSSQPACREVWRRDGSTGELPHQAHLLRCGGTGFDF